MTATSLQKHVKYVTNAKGQATDILISLKNKAVREAIEDWIDTQEAMARDDGDTIPWEEVKANLYKKLD